MELMSLAPISAMYRVRGMGVADSVSTSMPLKRSLNFSLCLTPKRCSSSITTRPRFLMDTSSEMRRCVPMTMSTAPDLSPSSVERTSAALLKRLSISIRTGYSLMRSLNVRKCCSASTVVGTSTATWRPPVTHLKAARMATSVLPKPTSPQIRRSMGRVASMSAFVWAMARSWSWVSRKGKELSNSHIHLLSGGWL